MPTDKQVALLEDYGLVLAQTPEYLSQYGIKGMRWGVRRDRRVLDKLAGREPSSSGSTASNDIVERAKRRTDKKTVRTMSTEEVKKKIDRLKLDKELRKLTNEDLAPIRTRLTAMLLDAGFDVGKTLSVAVLKTLIRKGLKDDVTAMEIAKYLRPKK